MLYCILYNDFTLYTPILSVGVPRDVGCRALVVYAAHLFSVQFTLRRQSSLPSSGRIVAALILESSGKVLSR